MKLSWLSNYPAVVAVDVRWIPVEPCSPRPIGIVFDNGSVFEVDFQDLWFVGLFSGDGDIDGDSADDQADQNDE